MPTEHIIMKQWIDNCCCCLIARITAHRTALHFFCSLNRARNSRVDMAGLVNNLLILFLVFQNICLGFRSPLSVFKRWVMQEDLMCWMHAITWYYGSTKSHVLDKNVYGISSVLLTCSEFSFCIFDTLVILKTESLVLSIGWSMKCEFKITKQQLIELFRLRHRCITQGVNIFQLLELVCSIKWCFNEKASSSLKLGNPGKFRGFWTQNCIGKL